MPHRFVIIGYGTMGITHIKKLTALGAEIAGVVDIDPRARDEAADKGLHVYADLAEGLADPTADALGLSPIWATPTKTDTDPALGLDGARRLVDLTAGAAITLGIGGINADNARDVIATGVDGVCVVSAIAASPDPRAAASRLLSLWSPA